MWDSSTSIFLRIFGNHDGNISIQNWSRWEISEEGDDEGWPWERLDPDGWYKFQETNWWLPFLIVFVYMLSIPVLKKWMRTRAPVTHPYLVRTMSFHNLLISMYSVLLLWRCSPRLIKALSYQQNWFHHLACERWCKLRSFLDLLSC